MARPGALACKGMPSPPMSGRQPRAYRWVKTECGRAKYEQLASPADLLSRLRLGWFVAIAALRDWRLPDPDQH